MLKHECDVMFCLLMVWTGTISDVTYADMLWGMTYSAFEFIPDATRIKLYFLVQQTM
jgi:hypothetical protein